MVKSTLYTFHDFMRPSKFARTFSIMAELPAASKRQKLTGRAFYESIGKPIYILAPMVDQSEFVSVLLLVKLQNCMN